MTTTIPPTPARCSPSQTAGPFFHDCLLRPDACRNVLVPSPDGEEKTRSSASPETAGERIRVEGRILDGDGAPVPDALVEIWQANAAGRYNHPADSREYAALDARFIGFGRSGTDMDGRFWFETIRPGAVPLAGPLGPGSDGERMQAPHLCVIILARGLLNHLTTRLYFADEPANQTDPVLQLVPAERRATLIAQPQIVDGQARYRWEIILQGAGETVFFNL